MNKKEFDLMFHETMLDVNSSFNSVQATIARKYEYEKISPLDSAESIQNFKTIENRQYTEELVYALLSKIVVEN